MDDRYLCKAKRIDDRKWIIGYYANINGKACIYTGKYKDYWSYSCAECFEVDPSTICQCTGLKDKNGKLIWENDIVDLFGHKGVVKYECGSFGIAYRESIDWEEIEGNICPVTGCDNALYACENDNYVSLWEIYWNFNDEDDCLSTVEVIGSAIDNPELLEVGE